MLTPWKKSYDQPRQNIKEQRHYFAGKGQSSQSYGFPVVMDRHELDYKESWALRNWCFWTMMLEKTLESLGLQGDPTSPPWRKSVLTLKLKLQYLSHLIKKLTHLKRPWCWEKLKAGGEGDGRGWDGWMASPTRWTWVWAHSGSWWWTGNPDELQLMGSQRVRHD